ncbi:hypothetical protein [Rudaea cellulosilytica]|uniref:hypothetical protein n=1 Tax=Rudaea cellulosilytica TaxID=540746 RepID=UPI00036667C0|nr:hypothetical protein [Rudaea cellulosilytica]
MNLRIPFSALLVVLGTPSAFAATALTPGTPLPVNFAPNTLITNAYIDVDASAKQLTVNVAGTGGDVDVFLRYGSPFPDTANCSTTATTPCMSYDMIQRYGQYHSMSSSSNESIVVTNASTIPLTAGRWYITAINGSSSSATATITATPSSTVSTANITIDFGHSSTNATDPTQNCDIAPWSDATAATPVGNNPGTSLGDQRKNALQYAVQQLAQQLNSPVPISVHACWAHLGGTASRATLAHAASTSLAFSDNSFPMPWLSKQFTWYTNTQIARMGGTSYCGAFGGDCTSADQDYGNLVEITFNSDIGTASVLGGSPFYFGYTSDSSSNSSDFIAIAMHEITHGLGFLGLANTDPSAGPIGARAGITNGATTVTYQNYDEGPWDDVFGDNVVNVASNGQSYTPFFGYELNSQPNNAARTAAMTSGNTVTATSTGDRFAPTLLRWSAPLGLNFSGQPTGSPPTSFPSLYAPCDMTKTTSCSTSVGSTLSHTVQQGDLMNAFYNVGQQRVMGLAAPMLAAMGWSTSAAPAAAFAQPFTGIWYDRAHSGHGLDFRLVSHTQDYGDVYLAYFYTYDATGSVEMFVAQGSVIDGVFIPSIIGADGSTLVRFHYDPIAKKATPTTNTGGSIVVDFNQAANSPACRNTDRSNAIMLGVMSWSFADSNGNVTEKGDWCVEPLTTLAQNASPDRGGLYYGGSSDSGWGFSVLDVNRGSAGEQVFSVLYYPDANGKPIWAIANMQPFVNGQTIPLIQNAAGYCRTCTPVAQNQVQAGTITLNFGTTNTATIVANYPGGSFTRTNVPLVNLGTQ